MKTKITLLIFLLFAAMAAEAQRFERRRSNSVNFLDLTAGAGFHTLTFDPEGGGDKNGRFGGLAYVSYRRAMTSRLHLSFGAGASLYSARSKFRKLDDYQSMVDPENGEEYTFKSSFRNWEEIQRTINVEIPIGAYYVRKIKGMSWQLIVGGGVRLDLPVMKKFKTDNTERGKLILSGKFDSTNVEYEDLEEHGFYDSGSAAGTAEMKGYGVSLFADGGLQRKLRNGKWLWLGLYFSHSLIDGLDSDGAKSLFDAGSDSYKGVASSNLVDKSYQMSLGIKATYSFGF